MRTAKIGRREFLRLSAGTAVGALLAACAPPAAAPPAGGKEAAAPTAKPKEAAKEAIKISIMWRTNPTENPMLEDLIKAWDQKDTGIKVELIVVPWDEYEPKLMSMYAGGISPDIMGTGGTNPHAERAVRGMVLPLDPYLDTDSELKNDFYPVTIKAYTLGGKLIALPLCICWPGVFINATLFEQAGVDLPPTDWKGAGWTWEDMIETARKLTLDKNGDGKVDQYGLNPGHSSPWYYTRLWGEDLVSQDDYASGILHKWQTDDPNVYDALVAGLQARADAIYKDEVTPTPATAQSLSQMGPMLKTGAVAMEFTGAWAIWGNLPEQFKFSEAPNPLGGADGHGTRGNNLWIDPLQISSQTKHPEAAWKFSRWMVADTEAIKIEVPYRSVVPAVRSGFPIFMEGRGGRLVLSKDTEAKFIQEAIEVATSDVPCHILVGWAAIRDIFRSELEPVWLGQKTVKEAVDTMIPLVQEGIQKNLNQLGLT
ncbi:MAG: sugar ABC transporter substrate-binding protein [Anaerolineae bacterium]|nr:sugar ABC transporter substrate-binding protein [Anaerolineae bacterium]